MKKFIVITSIFEPTDAVKAFSNLKDYQLVVVGDKKSPNNWKYDNVIYLSVQEQIDSKFRLSKVLPFNHYSRKMIGYLYAMDKQADYIIDTDDDNLPKDDWCFPEFISKFDCLKKNMGFVNIYQMFTEQKIWPRGLPLSLINTDFNLNKLISLRECNVGIWQGLADEDPDVDAIYRLTSDVPCFFNKRNPIVLDKGTICPFNTQNTLIIKQLFPLLYLPTFVTFRFTDILRGLVAQPIMWLYNFHLGFTNATVTQKRNPHDYMKDFISEVPMYEHCEKVVETVNNVILERNSITDNLYSAYNALQKKSIVPDDEMVALEAWLKDIEKPGI